jgi:hypothetical protein
MIAVSVFVTPFSTVPSVLSGSVIGGNFEIIMTYCRSKSRVER